MEEQSESVEQVIFGTKATIVNKSTDQSMKLDRSVNWDGHAAGHGHFPATIQPNSSSTFFLVLGSTSGAVQYSCVNAAGTPCAWILAWCSPTDTTRKNERKVYVTCGDEDSVSRIDSDQIKQLLHDSGHDSRHEDKETGTTAHASIDATGPNYAILIADFGFMNCDV